MEGFFTCIRYVIIDIDRVIGNEIEEIFSFFNCQNYRIKANAINKRIIRTRLFSMFKEFFYLSIHSLKLLSIEIKFFISLI